ncbi:alanine--tRNA ligase [Anoxynatronum sibiricum]|uniref:Alanine--tRNA ligase n=1 Tax=Anoxynatronum sibiricum TaxID=210623 RepID=A0ABU9VQ30_9CLOT
MEKKGINEIRQAFLEFFESKNHLVRPSFSLIPKDDNSLLLINSGMAPLKPFFAGTQVPPKKRMATSQKCIRTGDIENVGKTARHATFFEMLGNFSFGDYFKKEAIRWSWEFSLDHLKLPPERIWASIYEEDDEAFHLWRQEVGLPEERIVRLGKEDNFWEIGLGPCGPCSELYFDRGEKYGCGDAACKPGCECDRYVEYWNLVFTQFNKDEAGNYTPLPNPNIDTGMGLERVACMLQEVDSIFEIDGMRVILDNICERSGVAYGENHQHDISIRIITDHIRSITFMISDGILPSNEGRGYVLRRLLRRAARHGKLLGLNQAFLYLLMDQVVEKFHSGYPELMEKQEMIRKVILVEEDRFQETIHQGSEMLSAYIETMKSKGQQVLSGSQAFRLYDTFGFPLDLTKEILEEAGMTVDEPAFKAEMEQQKTRARNARSEAGAVGWKEDPLTILTAVPQTNFVGYDSLAVSATVTALIQEGTSVERGPAEKGTTLFVLLDQTPFYGEGGGQVGDQGVLKGATFIGRVVDTRKGSGEVIYHVVEADQGQIAVGDTLQAIVTSERRADTARNHTATHLLHKSLKHILGEHVQQAGSLVTPERLRFDFNHFEPMTAEELETVETIVNQQIQRSLPVQIMETSMEKARSLGAEALFDAKYGETVRVVKTGDFSLELCGGTHVNNSGEIGMLLILGESGIASGVRRIEAVTGTGAYRLFKQHQETLQIMASLLKTRQERLLPRLEEMIQENREKDQLIQKMKQEQMKDQQGDLLQNAVTIGQTAVVITSLEGQSMDALRELGDRIKDKAGSAVILLASHEDEKVHIMATLSKDLVEKGLHAGKLVKEVAAITGGGGGGRPDMAQAGGKKPDKIPEALSRAMEMIQQALA